MAKKKEEPRKDDNFVSWMKLSFSRDADFGRQYIPLAIEEHDKTVKEHRRLECDAVVDNVEALLYELESGRIKSMKDMIKKVNALRHRIKMHKCPKCEKLGYSETGFIEPSAGGWTCNLCNYRGFSPKKKVYSLGES